MLKIGLISVGKLKERHWRSAQEEYLMRLRPMARIELIETPSAAITSSFGANQSMKKEAEGILKRLPEEATVIALTVEGKPHSSEQFSERLMKADSLGRPVYFVIGGAAGLDQSVTARADLQVSLSPMTLTHEMARVLLLEQIYRGLAIASGKKYHY